MDICFVFQLVSLLDKDYSTSASQRLYFILVHVPQINAYTQVLGRPQKYNYIQYPYTH